MNRQFTGGSMNLPRKFQRIIATANLTVIAVLSGSLMFMADLLRRIPLPLKLDFLSAASYHGKARSEERRVGKECRSRGSQHIKKKELETRMRKPYMTI